VEGSIPSEKKEETANKVGARNVGTPATLDSLPAPMVGRL
jgi:hypothetical protein